MNVSNLTNAASTNMIIMKQISKIQSGVQPSATLTDSELCMYIILESSK